MATDKAELMRRLRKQRRDAGLVQMTVWVKPEQKRKVEAYIKYRLNGQVGS